MWRKCAKGRPRAQSVCRCAAQINSQDEAMSVRHRHYCHFGPLSRDPDRVRLVSRDQSQRWIDREAQNNASSLDQERAGAGDSFVNLYDVALLFKQIASSRTLPSRQTIRFRPQRGVR